MCLPRVVVPPPHSMPVTGRCNLFKKVWRDTLKLGRPQGFIESVVRTSLKDYNSHWRKYKRWCLEEGLHPWVSFDHTQVSVTMARDQLMAFLNFVKPSMRANSTFCNHKSAVVCSFRILFGFELGKDPLITQWMKG